MSDRVVQLVRLGKIGNPKSLDRLQISMVNGYPVLFGKGEFKEGDYAIHVPPDMIVQTEWENPLNGMKPFSFLKDKAASDGRYRVRFVRFSGVPSYGFLIPVDSVPLFTGPTGGPAIEAWWGQDLSSFLGITKYESDPAYQMGTHTSGTIVRHPLEQMVPLYDIANLRRYQNLFQDSEEVWVTEKLHGTNGRWIYLHNQLFCGSRQKFRQDSVWNRVAERFKLEEILSQPENQGLVLYGEIVGPGIQGGYTYGFQQPTPFFFDVFSTSEGRWYNAREFQEWCRTWGLPVVPTLYTGPAGACDFFSLAEGFTTIPGANHLREGVVIKPTTERTDGKIRGGTAGRVFLKLHGEGFLLNAGKTVFNGPWPEDGTNTVCTWGRFMDAVQRFKQAVSRCLSSGGGIWSRLTQGRKKFNAGMKP